jgi:hypothetical protein
MIEAHITMTGKSYDPRDEYRIFGEDRKVFADMGEVRQWLDEQYGSSRRQAMYVDTKDGRTKRCGYVIGFRNADLSHYPVDKWLQQDWISFSECKTVDLDATESC